MYSIHGDVSKVGYFFDIPETVQKLKVLDSPLLLLGITAFHGGRCGGAVSEIDICSAVTF